MRNVPFTQRNHTLLSLHTQYAQIVAGLSFNLSIQFPENFEKTTGVMGAANLNIFTLLPFGCYMNTNHHSKVFLYTIVPTSLSLVALIVFWVYSAQPKMRGFRYKLFTAVLSMNSFILPMITTLLFSMFPCQEFDDSRRLLQVDLSIDCESGAHKAMLGYTSAMIFVYIALFPCACYVLLWRVRGKVCPRKKDGSLYPFEEAVVKRDAHDEIQYLKFLCE